MTMALHMFSLISGNHPAPTTMMSSDATKGQVSDVYGQLHPKETPELIAQKLTEMESEIEKLAADTSTTKQNCLQLQQAQKRCPELLTDGFKLMFLRCEVFNANVSYICCAFIVCMYQV
jgi:hypothetical protein